MVILLASSSRSDLSAIDISSEKTTSRSEQASNKNVYFTASLRERAFFVQAVRIFVMTEADKCKVTEILILTDRSATFRFDTIRPVPLPMWHGLRQRYVCVIYYCNP
jgi:hypothetical protein